VDDLKHPWGGPQRAWINVTTEDGELIERIEVPRDDVLGAPGLPHQPSFSIEDLSLVKHNERKASRR
jgi:hypothetical protein